MSLPRIQGEFDKRGYSEMAYIAKQEFVRILNELMKNGEQFHEEVSSQLWKQATGENPEKEVRVSHLCTVIVDAQNILSTRIAETTQQIQAIQSEKRKLGPSALKENPKRLQEMEKQLNFLYDYKESLEEDFYLVTQPFGIRTRKGNSAANGEQSQVPAKQSEQLTLLFYAILAFGFLEVIIMYGKSDFLNLIVLACLLSLYLMNFFDKVYIRFTLALLAVSLALDIVWLVLYAQHKWSPATISNDSIYKISYTRSIVIFTSALVPLKGLMIFWLSKYRNSQNQSRVVSLGIVKMMLSGSTSNPISKSLAKTSIFIH